MEDNQKFVVGLLTFIVIVVLLSEMFDELPIDFERREREEREKEIDSVIQSIKTEMDDKINNDESTMEDFQTQISCRLFEANLSECYLKGGELLKVNGEIRNHVARNNPLTYAYHWYFQIGCYDEDDKLIYYEPDFYDSNINEKRHCKSNYSKEIFFLYRDGRRGGSYTNEFKCNYTEDLSNYSCDTIVDAKILGMGLNYTIRRRACVNHSEFDFQKSVVIDLVEEYRRKCLVG